MLKLSKDEPECFKSFKTKYTPHSYGDDCDDHTLRECLRVALLSEQNKQCFYCEKKIENDTAKVHIDHIKQRNIYHKLECEYSNMVLSCNGNGEKHCGKYKDKRGVWDDSKYIRIVSDSELQENPVDFFDYMSHGDIKVKKSLGEDKTRRANNTIEYLNLNDTELVKTRRKIVLQLEMYKQSGFDIGEIFTYFNEFESLFKEL